jgi:hypothetical protein
MVTSTGSTHQTLLSLGFPLPTYAFTTSIDTDLGGESIQWHCYAALTSNSGVLQYSSTALTKKLAISEASALILAAIQSQDHIGPEVPVTVTDEREAGPGFLNKVPRHALDSGEARESRSLCREYGVEYIRAALVHYSHASAAARAQMPVRVISVEPEGDPIPMPRPFTGQWESDM